MGKGHYDACIRNCIQILAKEKIENLIGNVLQCVSDLLERRTEILCVLFSDKATWFVNKNGLRLESMDSERTVEIISELKENLGKENPAYNLGDGLQYVFETIITTAYIPIYFSGSLIGYTLLRWNNSVRLEPEQQKFLEDISHLIGIGSYYRLLNLKETDQMDLQDIYQLSIRQNEQEKKRLSRELHDGIGQRLTSVTLQTKGLIREMERRPPEKFLDRLSVIHNMIKETISEIRRISRGLRPSILDNLGVVPAIRWYLQEYEETKDFQIDFSTVDMPDRLNEDVELALFRAVQEAVTNVVNHANARNVAIQMRCSDNHIFLDIKDDGDGIAESKTTHGLGLISMNERIAMLGGDIRIYSGDGVGTIVKITVPLKEKGDDNV